MERFHEYNEKSAGVKEYYFNSGCAYIRLNVDDPDVAAEEVHRWIIRELNKRGLVQ